MAKKKTTAEKYSEHTIKKDEWKRCSEPYVIDTDKRTKYIDEPQKGKKLKPFKLENPKFTE
ncbi:hypothetical protein DRN69_06675 [Candidatus Pacearchaeota archaeon]|nr:MAG: hypothetical protein DRN69_06675 [Candidatus Pacearchaeota archaeon]